jgi:basic membrane protein A
MASRREFLKLIGALGAAAAAGALGWAAIRGGKGATTTSEASPTTAQSTRTRTQQATGTAAPSSGGRVRALWVYVGPIGDYGWTHAHDAGRREAEKALGGLVETKYLEKVSEDQAYQAIKQALESEHFDAVFATSLGFADAVSRLARHMLIYQCYQRKHKLLY